MIELLTKRLLLRDHIWGDLETHHKLFSDKQVMYHLPDLKTHSLKESRANLETAIEQAGREKRRCYFLRIEELATNAHVGEIGYTVIDFTPVGKIVHMGYFTHKAFWGKGYVSEAAAELIRFAFEINGVFRISTGCLKENIGSERVMQKCGMIKEADFLKKEWHDGKMKDRVEYRLLREEWRPAAGGIHV